MEIGIVVVRSIVVGVLKCRRLKDHRSFLPIGCGLPLVFARSEARVGREPGLLNRRDAVLKMGLMSMTLGLIVIVAQNGRESVIEL